MCQPSSSSTTLLHRATVTSSRILLYRTSIPVKMLLSLVLLMACGAGMASAQRVLALPDVRNCVNRVKHTTWTDPQGVSHNYFFSWRHRPTAQLEIDWLDARNVCRRHCMDLVSLETLQENEFVKARMTQDQVKYIWTSGRKCDFDGCSRQDLRPIIVNGWFWSGSGAKVPPTNQRHLGGWSETGLDGKPQPDNREEDGESCLAILNNFYNDGVVWHDVNCDHEKPFICEDSDELLDHVRRQNPTVSL